MEAADPAFLYLAVYSALYLLMYSAWLALQLDRREWPAPRARKHARTYIQYECTHVSCFTAISIFQYEAILIDSFLAAQLSNAVLAAQAFQHDADLVFRRKVSPRRTGGRALSLYRGGPADAPHRASLKDFAA